VIESTTCVRTTWLMVALTGLGSGDGVSDVAPHLRPVTEAEHRAIRSNQRGLGMFD